MCRRPPRSTRTATLLPYTTIVRAEYIGEAAGDSAGTSVSGAGDVDGDGYSDVLVGAHDNDDGGTSAGAAYLVLGSAVPSTASLATAVRSEEHTSELQSLMRISYAVFCLKKKIQTTSRH